MELNTRAILVFIVVFSIISIIANAWSSTTGNSIIYFDNNATTRTFDHSVALMSHIYRHAYGNASANYKLGARSKQILESCRKHMAEMLKCAPCEIFFTSGATESNNIAIRGVYTKHRDRGKHIVMTAIEHPSVAETINSLPGAEVTVLPVDKYGKVDLADLRNAIRKDTILVSIIVGNNELGVIQDIRGMAAICRRAKVHMHADLTQIVGKYDVNLASLGVDSAAGSGHKFHGPKATGVLFLKKGTYFDSCISGGHQEKNIRAGTENIPGIVGMCYSLHICMQKLERGEHKQVQAMRTWIRDELVRLYPDSTVNEHPVDQMYNTLSICLPVSARKLVMHLDKRGICVNTGSACSKGAGSKILAAIGLPAEKQDGVVRISLGFMNTWSDCKALVKAVRDFGRQK